ncbi:general substrate transporter [Aureobasidium pullulans]|nr:general substrate transporter [Aureobasidium pullulans]
MSSLTGKKLDYLITAAAGSGFLLFGYDQAIEGVMSGLLTGAAFTAQFPAIDTTRNPKAASLQGTVVAIYEIGCFFGAILAFLFGERIGRRWSIMAGCAILSVGAAIQTSAYGVPQLIAGRIVAGLGNGINTATIPVWHSELMKPTSRGKGLSIELAINIFGVMTSYWVDYGMSFVNSEAQFRFPIALQVLFALVTIALLAILPESPRWLIAHDRADEARVILRRLQKNGASITDDNPIINAEMTEITYALQEERAAAGNIGFLTLFKKSPQRFRRRTLLGIGGQFMQQLCGINLITYYAPVIFQQSVGMPHKTAMLLAGFNGIAYFLTSLIPIWCLDRVGRRPLMLFANAGQMCCMIVLAITVSNGSKAAGLVATVTLFVFNGFFSIGMLAIPWLLPSEYAPLAIRTKAAALSAASNWIFTFLVVEITPVSITNIGYKTYVYFAVFNACFIPLTYFFYPEVRNLSLEQIDLLFTGDKVLLHWKDSMGDRQGSFAMEADPKAEVEHVDIIGEKGHQVI